MIRRGTAAASARPTRPRPGARGPALPVAVGFRPMIPVRRRVPSPLAWPARRRPGLRRRRLRPVPGPPGSGALAVHAGLCGSCPVRGRAGILSTEPE